MKKYTPNFNDPRVQRKAKSALAWATHMLSEHREQGWSKHHLDTKIGYAHNSLGAWLRSQLLTVTKNHYSMDRGETKHYTLNLRGAAHIAEQLGIEYNPRKIRTSIGIRTAIEQYEPLFSTAFAYTHKSNRSYHELQNLRTDIRTPVFAHYGFKFNYDVENAYPTLLLQHAEQSANLRKPLSTLKDYVQAPQQYRQALAQSLGCDIKLSKRLILARFNGATLRNTGAIRNMLTAIQFHKLKKNPWFELLNQDIKRAWMCIARSLNKNSLNNRAKMEIYLSLEKQVMSAIQREFSKKNIPMFLEHDGWRSKDYIDPYMLKLQVKKKSGFDVNFTCEVLK